MAKLSATERARLPDSAFAYIDGAGHRRLPINDEAHVRNALARFDRVRFDSDAARTQARRRLLNAAKKFGIVPVGFITGQIESEGRHAAAGRVVIELDGTSAPEELQQRLRRVLRDPTLTVLHWSDGAGSYVDGGGRPTPAPVAGDGRAVTYLEREGRPMAVLEHDPAILDDPALSDTVLSAVRFMIERERLQGELRAELADAASLPTGCVTFLLTDIEGSTGLLTAMGDGYADLLAGVRRIVRDGVLAAGGREVDARADEFFAVFERTQPAIEAAVAIQRTLAAASWPGEVQCRVRAGIHTGRPTLTDSGYIGLSVHAAARVSYAGHGGQIVVSGDAKDAAKEEGLPIAGIRYRSLPTVWPRTSRRSGPSPREGSESGPRGTLAVWTTRRSISHRLNHGPHRTSSRSDCSPGRSTRPAR
jgi:class 3 adenylate cyclase